MTTPHFIVALKHFFNLGYRTRTRFQHIVHPYNQSDTAATLARVIREADQDTLDTIMRANAAISAAVFTRQNELNTREAWLEEQIRKQGEERTLESVGRRIGLEGVDLEPLIKVDRVIEAHKVKYPSTAKRQAGTALGLEGEDLEHLVERSRTTP